jgi:hypothetical protein
VIRAIVAALALVGCVNEQPPQLYTCAVLYRCTGGANLEAALTLPCAVDPDDALEQAEATGIAAALERCPSGAWQSVRPLCSAYKPAESCADSEQ